MCYASYYSRTNGLNHFKNLIRLQCKDLKNECAILIITLVKLDKNIFIIEFLILFRYDSIDLVKTTIEDGINLNISSLKCKY